MPKVAIITCYKEPDYVRAQTLRSGLAAIDSIELIVLKNRIKGLGRFVEMPCRCLWLRLSKSPDAYILTFRGYELLPWLRLVSWGKPLVFDEFVNPLEVVAEHQQLRQGTLVGRLMAGWRWLGGVYYFWLRRCQAVLMDTMPHAELAARWSGLPVNRYRVMPVSADESLFVSSWQPPQQFSVLYYGSMLPLHGLSTVLESAIMLKGQPIRFEIIGGNRGVQQAVASAVERGAQIHYRSQVPYATLPDEIAKASLCLAGPFGDTLQSGLVITGKTYQILSVGAPLVLGSNPATAPYFTDRQNALVVPRANARELAESIAWAASHGPELKKIAARGQRTYRQDFSQQALMDLLQELLRTVLL